MPQQNNLITSKLAAFIGIAHIEINDYLDSEADRTSKPFEQVIQQILSLPAMPAYRVEYECHRILATLPNAVGKHVYDALMKAGTMSAERVAVALVKGVPLEYMPLEMLSKGYTQEAFGGAILKAIIKPFKRKPPAVVLTKKEVKRRFHSLLIEPIKKVVLEKIVLGGAAKIAQLMKYIRQSISPKKIADVLVKTIADGKDRRQQAQALRDELGATKAAAKRLVRTEGIRVATESNMAAYDELGSAVVAYMVHAVLDERTRPQHRIRNGWVYYKEPEEGQRSVADMPRPPVEPDGSIAWGCRCYISPVFADLENLDKKKFISNAHNLIASPLVYQDWWRTATERQKRIAVGSRRYDAVVAKHGKGASYFHFIDEKGDLISIDQLQAELPADTTVRIMRLRTIMGFAKLQKRDALLFGSV